MDRMLPGREYEYATLMNMLHVSVSKHLLDAHFTLVWANEFYYDLIGYGKDCLIRPLHSGEGERRPAREAPKAVSMATFSLGAHSQ